MEPMNKPHSQATTETLKELEINTAREWLATGAIKVTERGNENFYFENEFGHRFFCKCNEADLAPRRNKFVEELQATPPIHFNENDCGGVFDGNGVISDADPGL